MIDTLQRMYDSGPVTFETNNGIFIRGKTIYNGSKEISLDKLLLFDDIRVLLCENTPDKFLSMLREKLPGVLIVNEHRKYE